MPKRHKKRSVKKPNAVFVNISDTCSGEPADSNRPDSNGAVSDCVDQPPCLWCNGHDFTKKTWMTDMILKANGKPLYTNKAVLSLTSPVFRKMFEPGSASGCIIEVSVNRKFEDVRLFLNRMYPGPHEPLTPDTALSVVASASMFQCDHILKECENVFLENLNAAAETDNTLIHRYLSLGNKYSLDKLKGRAIEVSTFGMIERENKMIELLPREDMEVLRQTYACQSDIFTRTAKQVIRFIRGSSALRGYENGKGRLLERELTLDELSYAQHFEPKGLVTADFIIKDIVTLPPSRAYEVDGILWTIGTEMYADDNDVTLTIEANVAPEWITWSCKARLFFMFQEKNMSGYSHFVKEHIFGHTHRSLTYDQLIDRHVVLAMMLRLGLDKVTLQVALFVKDVKFTMRK